MKKIIKFLLASSFLGSLISCGAKDSVCSTLTTSPTSNIVDVYLIAGQSNAVGNGYLIDLPEAEQVDYEDVLYYANGDVEVSGKLTFVSSKIGSGQGMTKDFFGMEVGMAKRFSELSKQDHKKRAIIKCAYNGSSIKADGDSSRGDWNVFDDAGNGQNCKDLIRTVNDGIAAIQNLGYETNIVGLSWMQGEADYTSVNDYYDRFEAVMNYCKKELNKNDLLFAVGELAAQNFPKNSYNPFIRALHDLSINYEETLKIAKTSEYSCRCLDIEAGKGKYGAYDFVHWSGEEMLSVGQEFAKTFELFAK